MPTPSLLQRLKERKLVQLAVGYAGQGVRNAPSYILESKMAKKYAALRPAWVGVVFLAFGCSPADAPNPRSATAPDGVEIVYEVLGETDPTLVLVHGWSNNRHFWLPHSKALAQNHRVVALDLAGFGDSGRGRREWTMRNFGEDIAAVAGTLSSEELVLVGFSMGGAAVLEAARLIPEKVLGVVLVDAFQDPEVQSGDSAINALITHYRGLWHDRDPETIRGLGFSQETPDSLLHRYLSSTPDTVPEFWWDALEELFHWHDRDLQPSLQAIEAPVYAINSDRIPTNVDAFRRYNPTFEVGIMPGVGHLGVIWEELDLFEELLLQAVDRMDET